MKNLICNFKSLLILLLTTGFLLMGMQISFAQVPTNVPITTVSQHTHRVEKGETLWRISQMFNLSIRDLKMANPQIVGTSISVGQFINIPMMRETAYNRHVVAASSNEQEIISISTAPTQAVETGVTNIPIQGNMNSNNTLYDRQGLTNLENADLQNSIANANHSIENNAIILEPLVLPQHASASTSALVVGTPLSNMPVRTRILNHEVQRGENLYAISKAYGVSVNDIMMWNKLKSIDLSIGDRLMLFVPTNATPAPVAVSSTPVPFTIYEKEFRNLDRDSRYQKVKASGKGFIIEDEYKDLPNLEIIHHSAPIGSAVRIENPVNGRVIYGVVAARTNQTQQTLQREIGIQKSAAIWLSYPRSGTLLHTYYHQKRNQ